MKDDPQVSQEALDASPELESDWSSVNFTSNTLLLKNDLMSGCLEVTLNLGGGIQLPGNVHFLEVADPPLGV